MTHEMEKILSVHGSSQLGTLKGRFGPDFGASVTRLAYLHEMRPRRRLFNGFNLFLKKKSKFETKKVR